MFYTCIQKFDVTGNLENFWELNMAKLDFVDAAMVSEILEQRFVYNLKQ